MSQSVWPPPVAAVSQIRSDVVEEDAVRIRSIGTGLVIASVVLLLGGMIIEQGFVLLAGLITFFIALLFRRIETKRALAALPPAHAEAVAHEVNRTAVRVSILRSILLTILAHVFVGLMIWVGTR